MRKENSTNTLNDVHITASCNAHRTLRMISGRWKLSILFSIDRVGNSFSELKKALPTITDRVLAKQLTELVEDGLLFKTKGKISSSYQFTDKGLRIYPLLLSLRNFNHDGP
ncbi:winged helix-turn-helix transcriptional regulator [Sphingobacterium sp. LRF_L2]|uniref:winged helix-turn-helix transcriptional regulator n=1 Tax=Sphingobacterium sp. LRF_L2 TaxID=3369421 RepID=UPI003F6154A6